MCLYVDDILIFGTNTDVIDEVKSFLSSRFDMKDLGEASVILNIKLIKNENEIILNQSHYVEKYCVALALRMPKYPLRPTMLV